MSTARSGEGAAPDSPLSGRSDESEQKPELRNTLQMIASIAVPNIAAYVLNLVNELTNTVFLGHTNDESALAAVGLGNMMQNCFGLSIGFGFSAALDMLVTQAYAAGHHERCCHHLQCCRVLTTLNLFWMVPFLYYSEHFLKMIQQPENVAENAGAYNRVTAIGLFFVFQFEANRKFMHNRGWTKAPAVICAVSSMLHIFWCCVFILHFRLGNAGAGWANVATWVTEFLASSYVLLRNCRDMGGLKVGDVLGFSWKGACTGWGEYLSIAIPATIQMCSEWWFWEICALIIGYLGPTSLAAHVATINFAAVTFMPTIGISASTATLIQSSLAADRPKLARQTVWVCVFLNLVLWLFLAIVIVLCNGAVSMAYSDSTDVREQMHWLLCLFAISGFADTTQNVMGGALRGLGRQHAAATVYLVSFYFVMLPIGCLLAFWMDTGVYGMYISFLPGCGMAVFVFALLLCKVDWVELAREASSMMDMERSYGEESFDQGAGASMQHLNN